MASINIPPLRKENVKMNTLHIKIFGVAIETTTELRYIGCIMVMLTAGKEGSIQFFNNMNHDIDISSLIRMNVRISEGVKAIIPKIIVGWLTGTSLAEVYNFNENMGNHETI